MAAKYKAQIIGMKYSGIRYVVFHSISICYYFRVIFRVIFLLLDLKSVLSFISTLWCSSLEEETKCWFPDNFIFNQDQGISLNLRNMRRYWRFHARKVCRERQSPHIVHFFFYQDRAMWNCLLLVFPSARVTWLVHLSAQIHIIFKI